MSHVRDKIIRYSTPSRINHWITGICFVVLVLSGLAMFDPLTYLFSGLFGSGQWMRAAHPWFGVALTISYAGMIVQFWRDELWTADDTAWSKAVGRVIRNQEEGVPEIGRFNPGQKLVFWAMALLIPVLFFTGIVIWEVYFADYTTIPQQRFAVLLHSIAAIAAIIVWVVHVYSGIWIRGAMQAMMHGDVTPGWAYRHHRKWFRSLVETGSHGPHPNKRTQP